MVLALLALAASACAGGARAPAGGDDIGGDAVREAKAVVSDAARAIRAGDSDGVISLTSEALVVIGPRPRDAYASRADAVLALRDNLGGPRKPKLTSAGATVTAGPGGRSAYVVERLALQRKPLWAIGLVEGDRGLWRIVALEVAAPVATAAARRAAKKKSLAAPGSRPPLGERPGAKDSTQAEGELRRLWADPAAIVDALTRTEGVFLGADGVSVRGAKLASLGKRLAAWRYELGDELVSIATSDDALAYVTTAATRTPERGDPEAVRLSAIFRRSASGWDLVVLRESQAIDQGS